MPKYLVVIEQGERNLWGHSVESLRRLSEALGATLELHLRRRAA